MKRIFSSLTLLFSSVALSQAVTTISVDSGGLDYISSSGGSLSGSAVRVGVFDVSGANDATVRNSNVFGDVDALFTPLGEGQANGGTVDQVGNAGSVLIINDKAGSSDEAGAVTGSIKDIDDGYFASGTQLYVWVFNASDPASATEWGIFTSTGWVDPTPNPLFPFIPAIGPVSTTGLDDSSLEALRGSVDNGVGLRLDQIPEPTALVTLLGALAAFGLRRRR